MGTRLLACFAGFFLIQAPLISQSACDSVYIDDIYYHSPYSDSLIAIDVRNESQALFDYPGFLLLNSSGDTLAKETVSLFGIANNSMHQLTVYPGVDLKDPFNGTLELWTGFYIARACSFHQQVDLCSGCHTIYPTIANWGGGITVATFDYVIRTAAGTVQTSGTLALDSNQYPDHDTICLPTGAYKMEIIADHASGSGGQPWIHMETKNFLQNNEIPHKQLNYDTTVLDFVINPACVGALNGVAAPRPQAFKCWVSRTNLNVITSENDIIDGITVIDITGRITYQSRLTSTSAQINVQRWPSGIYIVIAEEHTQKVFIP